MPNFGRFVELGAARNLASTIVPTFKRRCCSSGSPHTALYICAVDWCDSSNCRKRRMVDSSGTVSSLSSTRTNRRIHSETYDRSSAQGPGRSNHCWRWYVRSIVSSGKGRPPGLVTG